MTGHDPNIRGVTNSRLTWAIQRDPASKNGRDGVEKMARGWPCFCSRSTSNPNSDIRWFTMACNFSSRGSDTSGLCGPHSHILPTVDIIQNKNLVLRKRMYEDIFRFRSRHMPLSLLIPIACYCSHDTIQHLSSSFVSDWQGNCRKDSPCMHC